VSSADKRSWVEQIANRHGGQLRLAQSDSGATFELVVPALNDSDHRKI
jgi:hypothetical protein